MVSTTTYRVDPDNPIAPPLEVWERMSRTERQLVVDSLPSDVPFELYPSEGDDHFEGKTQPLYSLRRFFKSRGRKSYLSAEQVTYYPGEPRFVPDLLAVLDVDDHHRDKWVVAHEGRGLDLVIEVHLSGSRKMDFETNVERYARLGIPEYFILDVNSSSLRGFRLRSQSEREYEPIMPQVGRYESLILDLDLSVKGGRLRFFYGTAPVPETEELVEQLQGMVDEIVEKKVAAEKQLEQERQRLVQAEADLDAERRRAREAEERAERAERELAELQARIEGKGNNG